MSFLPSNFVFQLLRIIEKFSFLSCQDLKSSVKSGDFFGIYDFFERIFRNNNTIYLLYGAVFFGLRFRFVTFEVHLFDGFGCSFSGESIVKSIGGIIDVLGCSWRLGCRGRRIPLSLIFGGIATSRTAEWSNCTRFLIRFLFLFLL